MTSEGLGEMFEGDSADTCSRNFPLVSMGGPAEGLTYADPGSALADISNICLQVNQFKYYILL